MKYLLIIATLALAQFSSAQVNYGVPPDGLVPEPLQELPVEIIVNNFPVSIDAYYLNEKYYWKHTTAVLSLNSDMQIIEYGAYLFYNDTWNLRRSYPLRALKKWFGIKNSTIMQGQPYTWPDNWRIDSGLYEGYAMWYFIALNADGEKVCGYQKIYTSDKVLNR